MPDKEKIVETSTRTMSTDLDLPKVLSVDTSYPWKWLKQGLDDLKANPVASLFYGVIFVLMGHGLLWLMGHAVQLELALATAFLLLAPFLATGLYDLSRRRERGESTGLLHSMTAWRRNMVSIAVFAAALGIITVAWIRLSALMFAVTFIGASSPTVGASVADLYFSGAGLQFLVVFFVIGACVAALVFAVSVISVPMLLDRKVDFFTAAATSFKTVGKNPKPMLLWAAMIAGLTLIGLAPMFLGLAVTMPIVGHASWHAYRDLVEPEPEPEPDSKN